MTKWFRRIAIGATALATVLLGVNAAMHVASGEGASTYTNVKSVHITWGSALGFVVALAAALVAALVARWWQLRGGWRAIVPVKRTSLGKNDGPPDAANAVSSNKSPEYTREE